MLWNKPRRKSSSQIGGEWHLSVAALDFYFYRMKSTAWVNVLYLPPQAQSRGLPQEAGDGQLLAP